MSNQDLFYRAALAAALGLAGLLVGHSSLAQVQIRDIDTDAKPAASAPSAPSTQGNTGDTQPPAAPAPAPVQVDLGEDPGARSVRLGDANPGQASNPAGPGTVGMVGIAANAATLAKAGAPGAVPPRPAAPGTERAVFARVPIKVSLPVKRERLITLPSAAALHVPDDIDAVLKIQAIDRTVYLTALVPFAPIRIVAELLEGGQQIPLDLQADAHTQTTAELEVFLPTAPAAPVAAGTAPAATLPAADMVELTRFAARMLYAPKRLALAQENIQQVMLTQRPVAGLLRGAPVHTIPIAQWKSGDLYVTAVRVSNQSSRPLELVLEDLRGNWVAASAQHGRLGPAGSELDTTAIYLICERRFESCL